MAVSPSHAQTYDPNYPVCFQITEWGGAHIDCSFTSMPQCQATASNLGLCFANPYFLRSPRLRNPGQLRRGERYRQNPPLKGVKIGRRYGVKFERRLTDVLKDYTRDGGRVLFIFHPHLEHLKPDTAGHVWNDLVSSTVQKTCDANNFLFFNATETLKQRFGSHPENFYSRTGDMHYNFKGLEEYSAAVAAFMASAMINPKD